MKPGGRAATIWRTWTPCAVVVEKTSGARPRLAAEILTVEVIGSTMVDASGSNVASGPTT